MAPQALPTPPSPSEAMTVAPASPPTAAFTNQRVAPDQLPRLDPGSFEPVAPAFARMRLFMVGLSSVVGTVLVGVVGLAVLDLALPVVITAVAAVLAACLAIALFQRAEARRMGYQVRSHDFSFRRGVVWRRVDTMPFARVQHAVIRRGPVERFFGLATLHLRSAGGSLLVTGLDTDRSDRLKTLVVERAGALADEELMEQG